MDRVRNHRFSIPARLASAVVALAVLAGAVGPLAAQAVPVPGLTPQGFDEAEFRALYDSAAGAQNMADWQSMIEQGYMIVPSWETAALAEMDAHIFAVTDGDAFNDDAAYQDYIRAALEMQHGENVSEWEAYARAMLADERALYLAGLMDDYGYRLDRDAHDGDRAKFDYDYLSGMREFETALYAVDDDYYSTIEELDAQNEYFRQRLAEVEQYETIVRSNINTQIADMSNFLASSGMFYDPATGGLNAAGQELQDLIDQVNNGLSNGTPLSVVSDTIATYMETRETEATTNQTTWTGQVNGSGTPGGTITAGDITKLPSEYEEINAIMEYVINGDSTLLQDVVRTKEGLDASIQITITNADARGYSMGYPPLAMQGGEWVSQLPAVMVNVDGTPIDARWAAFTYHIIGCYGVNAYNANNCGDPTHGYRVPEQHFQYTISYTSVDTNAQANATTWGGYATAISPVRNTWRNDVTPAIEIWEAQTAALEANYQAYQAQANGIRTQAEAQRAESRASIIEERAAFMNSASRMEATAETIAARSTAGGTLAEDPGAAPAPRVNAAEILNRSTSSNSLAAARNLGATTVSAVAAPDASALQSFLTTTQKSFTGLQNFAYTKSIQIEAERARADTLEMIQRMVSQNNVDEIRGLVKYNPYEDVPVLFRPEGWEREEAERPETDEEMRERIEAQRARNYSVEVNKDGTITAHRDIKTGAAVWNGGDMTQTSAYSATYETQSFTIRPPQAIRLASGGDLFESWDYGKLQESHQENLTKYYSALDNKIQAAQGQLADADRLFNSREAAFQQAAAGQAQFASMVKSLATSMIGGMDLSSALFDYAKNQVIGQIAGHIETMTGIPAGFMSSLLGGANIEQAMTSYAWQVVGSEIDRVTGLSGFGGMLTSQLQSDMAAKKARNGPLGKMANSMAAMTAGGGIGAMAGFMMGGPLGLLAGAALGSVAGFAANDASGPGFAAPLSNAFYDNPMLMDATALAATSVTGNPALWYSYQGVKGYEEGGTVGAITKMADGALMATNAIVPGLEVSVSYTHEGGFGGSVGYGFEGVGSVGMSYSARDGAGAYARIDGGQDAVGFNISTSEHGGTSVGLTYGHQVSGGTTANFGLNYSTVNGFGVSAGVSQNITPNLTGTGGLSWSQGGGVGANASATFNAGNKDNSDTWKQPSNAANTSALDGTGLALDYNENTGLTATANLMGAALGSITQGGNFVYNENFSNDAGRAQVKRQMEAERAQRMAGGLDQYAEDNKNVFTEKEREEMGWDEMTPEEKAAALKEKAEEENIGLLGEDRGSSTEDSLLGDFLGKVRDLGLAFSGVQSGKYGYFDEEGYFHARTCFVAGTVVHTPSGQVVIESLRIGDEVLSWDEQTGEVSYMPVTDLFEHSVKLIFVLSLSGGSKLETTWNHPFYVSGKGWVETKDLRPGDSLILVTGSRATVESITRERREETVFNIEVAENHTYFVGSEGVLVHNYDVDLLKARRFSVHLFGEQDGLKFYSYLFGDDDNPLNNTQNPNGEAVSFDEALDLTDPTENGQSQDGGASRQLAAAIEKMAENPEEFEFHSKREKEQLQAMGEHLNEEKSALTAAITDANKEMSNLRAERAALSKKGSALTTAEQGRLAEIHDRIEAIPGEIQNFQSRQRDVSRAVQRNNTALDQLNTKEAIFRDARSWLLRSDLTAQEKANLTTRRICFVKAHHNLLAAEGKDTRSFDQYYYEEVSRGNIRADGNEGVYVGAGNLFGNQPNTGLQTNYTVVDNRKIYKPLPASNLEALRNSGRRYAMIWIDTDEAVGDHGNMRGDHYILIGKDEGGNWMTLDHTTRAGQDWRRGEKVENVWGRVRGLVYLND